MKQKPIRSPKHLARVRKMDCMITRDGEHCNGQPVDAHHLMRVGNRGMSLKEWDCWVVPLCRKIHHAEVTVTGDEPEFWKNYGFTYEQVKDYARELWEQTQNM